MFNFAMEPRFRSLYFAASFCLVLIVIQVSSSAASVTTQDFDAVYPKAIKVGNFWIYVNLIEISSSNRNPIGLLFINSVVWYRI